MPCAYRVFASLTRPAATRVLENSPWIGQPCSTVSHLELRSRVLKRSCRALRRCVPKI